ncbi:MAG: ROK family protein [Chthoniobacterales bacterium]|nr:ROK family protein [Chthoniobacterales bacterium]
MKRKVLVVDIGGTHVKLMISRTEKRKFDSGLRMSPKQLVTGVKKSIAGWEFDAVSIGFPSPVISGRITKDPKHLAKGWTNYNFGKALGKPVRLINDAAMQALGSYHGGRMLFLGLGTGLGSALVWDKNLLPLELGDLPYLGGNIETQLGKIGLEKLGRKEWEAEVHYAVAQLKLSFIADYIVLGGGNAKALTKIPAGAELGHNRNAYLGGARLWLTEASSRRQKWNVI